MAKRRKSKFPSLSRWAKDNRDLLLHADFSGKPLHKGWRTTEEYRAWKHTVLYRDRRCTNCGRDNKLQAHHIVPASVCPDLRFEPRNGRLLCKYCHSLDYMHQTDPHFWVRIVRDL